jgi:hypothetical protein
MANNDKSAESKTYKEQAGDFYNRQYDNWVPWMEDKYLQWFTKDNKASYATKRTSYANRATLSRALTAPPTHPASPNPVASPAPALS